MEEARNEGALGTPGRTYSADDLDGLGYLDWPTFRKVSLTHATRVNGPFTVKTSEGPLTCADGWLAVDARGYPYPIADDEFRLIYEPADPEQPLVEWPLPTLGDISGAVAGNVLTQAQGIEAARNLLRRHGLLNEVAVAS